MPLRQHFLKAEELGFFCSPLSPHLFEAVNLLALVVSDEKISVVAVTPGADGRALSSCPPDGLPPEARRCEHRIAAVVASCDLEGVLMAWLPALSGVVVTAIGNAQTQFK